MMMFWHAVALARPYANNLHLVPGQITTSTPDHSMFFTGRMLFLTPKQQSEKH